MHKLSDLPRLIDLSLESLPRLYNEEQGLFTFYIRQGRRAPMPLDWSLCYSAICYLGLHKISAGRRQASSIKAEKIPGALFDHWHKVARFGHLGLILWAGAECAGREAGEVLAAVRHKSSAEFLAQVPTTELAWLLIGLCALHPNRAAGSSSEALLAPIVQALLNNFNPHTGLFSHAQKKPGLSGLRSQIGNFADQSYAIFALAAYYEAFQDERALQCALHCAQRICALQGAQGQWWWHYHARQGIVVSRYPVFAVHQDGMAPMALQRLAQVSGVSFQAPILRGLNWLFQANELHAAMVDWEHKVIWRDIERQKPFAYTRYLAMAMAEIGFTRPLPALDPASGLAFGLKVNREMRPYELGWLLYAMQDTLDLNKGNP